MSKYHVCLADSDLYKFTMQSAICKLYPRVKARYEFINRKNRLFPAGFDKRLREIVDSFRDYHLTTSEKNFMREKCYYMDPVYLDFLSGYRYDPSEVTISQKDYNLFVSIVGPWYQTVLWEVPLMETISELYFEMTDQEGLSNSELFSKDEKKARDLTEIDAYFSEFGSRRRKSYENQNRVIGILKQYSEDHLLGTSNVHLAMINDLIPMGTIAHEWEQAHAAMFGFLRANIESLEAWVNVYDGSLGTALPDTFTTEAFYKYAFTTKHAKLWDGVRQDSGDPLEFIDRTIKQYRSLRILPRLKTILFSDDLKSIDQIKVIKNFINNQIPENRILDRYGIGTWFSNDTGVDPLNIVIKLTGIDFGHGWVNTIKLSDSPTKHTGDLETINFCLKTLGI